MLPSFLFVLSLFTVFWYCAVMDDLQCVDDLIRFLHVLEGCAQGVEQVEPGGPYQKYVAFTVNATREAKAGIAPDSGIWVVALEVTQIAMYVGVMVGLFVTPESQPGLISQLSEVLEHPDHPVVRAAIRHFESAMGVGLSLTEHRLPVTIPQAHTVDISNLN